jgi:acetyl-CoA carboxylase biotin carboxyl carrier protein
MSEIRAEITANVWQVHVAIGQQVSEGDEIAILESMKMEIPVIAESSGTIRQLHIAAGGTVREGDLIAEIEDSP